MSGMRASGIGNSGNRSQRRRLVAEPLEDRRMLAKLLTILVEEGDAFQVSNPTAFYDDVLFDSPTANVADFFSQSSDGQFTWERATPGNGVIGPFSIPGPRMQFESEAITAAEYVSLIRSEAIAAADSAGFDFSVYDINGDDFVRDDELSTMIILDAGSGGAVRSYDPVPVGSGDTAVTVLGSMASIGEESSFSTTAHELAHLAGAIDLYGDPANSCLSFRLTLMSCTGPEMYDFDPWHKEFLGWKQWPTFDLANPGTRVLKDSGISPADSGFILVDSRSPLNDKLYVELRPSGMSYDQPVGIQEGVAVWYVSENEDGSLASIELGGRGQLANVSVGPGVGGLVNVANAFAVGNTWQDGSYRMEWPDESRADSFFRVDRQLGGARYEFSWGIQEDIFEQNDTLATATNLGSSDQSWSNLTVDAADDDDYYRFTAVADGQLAVDLEFSHNVGDLDLRLLNSAGTTVASSSSTSDDESVSLNVDAGETFFIRVFGFSDAIHPEYRLSIDGPAIEPDIFEPNNTLGTATVLGSQDQSWSDLTIHDSFDSDYFAYSAPDDGSLTVDVLFEHSVGDIELVLMDSAGAVLTQSTSATDNEQVVWSVTSGETYIIQTYGYLNTTNPGYTLSIDGPAPPLPDLRAFLLDVDDGGNNQVSAGETIDVFFDYDNFLGTGPVAGDAFEVGFYLSTDEDIDPELDTLLTFREGVDLFPGTAFSDTVSVTLPGAGDVWSQGEGAYFIGIYVDDTFDVVELNETNNFLSEAVSVTIPLDGDFDQNGTHDCADVDGLVQVIASGTNQSQYDLNGDLLVNRDDLDVWLVLGGAANPAVTGGNAFLIGDANLDGNVDISDFNLWNSSKFTATAAWCNGDFNADGVVDTSDFNLWNGNKFQSAGGMLRGVPVQQLPNQDHGVSVVQDRYRQDNVRDRVFGDWYLL